MKITFLFATLMMSMFGFAQNWAYNNEFSIKHQKSDFNIKGKIKHITEIYTTTLSNGTTEKGNNLFDRMYQNHWNFNEDGNLESYYREGENGDTIIIQMFEYNEAGQLTKAIEYSSIWVGQKVCLTSDLNKNWSKITREYTYENGSLIKVKYTDSERDFNNAILTLTYENEVLSMAVATNLAGSETNFKYTFNYSKDLDFLKSIRITDSYAGYNDGIVKFIYDKKSGLLTERKEEYSPDDELSQGKAFPKNNVKFTSGGKIAYEGNSNGDFDEFTYNENEDVEKKYHEMNSDGHWAKTYLYTYVYDAQKNWTSRTLNFKQDSETYGNDDYIVETKRTIDYY